MIINKTQTMQYTKSIEIRRVFIIEKSSLEICYEWLEQLHRRRGEKKDTNPKIKLHLTLLFCKAKPLEHSKANVLKVKLEINLLCRVFLSLFHLRCNNRDALKCSNVK